MFKIYFIVEEDVFPDEYDLGWLNLEHNDKILTSMEYSGKGFNDDLLFSYRASKMPY